MQNCYSFQSAGPVTGYSFPGWQELSFSKHLVHKSYFDDFLAPFGFFYTPHTTKLLRGILVSLRPSVCPSVCPASRVRSVATTVLIGSISYDACYQTISGDVWRVKFLAKFQNSNFWQFFKIWNFDFVLFLLGIWCESLVWVIMGRRGVSQNTGVLVYNCFQQYKHDCVVWIYHIMVKLHGGHGISNHRQLPFEFNSIRLTTKKTSKLSIIDPLWGESTGNLAGMFPNHHTQLQLTECTNDT